MLSTGRRRFRRRGADRPAAVLGRITAGALRHEADTMDYPSCAGYGYPLFLGGWCHTRTVRVSLNPSYQDGLAVAVAQLRRWLRLGR